MRANTSGGTIDHYILISFKGGEDSKLESSKLFFYLSEQKTKLLLVIDALDAILHLIGNVENLQIIQYCLMALCNLAKEKEYTQKLVKEKQCFKVLAPIISSMNVPCQIVAVRCAGLLAQHPCSSGRFVSDGALLPIMCLLKKEQNIELLQEVFKTLAMSDLRGDCASRVIEVWGLELLGDVLRKHIEGYREVDITMVDLIAKVFGNFTKFEKIAVSMMHAEKLELVNMLRSLMNTSITHVETKRSAANTCFNLINNQYTIDPFLDNHQMIVFLMNRYQERDYLTKHCIAKTFDCIVRESKQHKIIALIDRYQNLEFVEWILRSNSCELIQVVVLRSFVKKDWIYEKSHLFSTTFVPSLLTTIKETISRDVRRVCDEVVYHMSAIERFQKEIIDAGGGDILSPQLAFKDRTSKYWGVKTLARMLRNKEYATIFVKQYGIVKAAVNCFITTSHTDIDEYDVFMGVLHILSDISDTQEFRLYFMHSGAINKMLDILESQNHDQKKIILCLNIVISYVNSANKGSSGNANLKILSEKKLQRIIESITSTNFSLSGKVVALIAAYAQHSNSPIFDFWNILYSKALNVIRCNEDYNSYLYQRISCFQMLTNILSKDHIWSNLDLEMVAEHYILIFCNSNLLSHLKSVSAKGLLEFCKYSPDVMEELLIRHERSIVSGHKHLDFGNNICFSNIQSFSQFIRIFLQFFEKERKKKMRKYLLFSKIQRFLLFLLSFVREKKENHDLVDCLITQVSDHNLSFKIKSGNRPTRNYVPLRHKHFYSGYLDGLIGGIPHQPSSVDTQHRLREFLTAKQDEGITNHILYKKEKGNDSVREMGK
ncbi:predicted protein [Naegleria gruberi]|uniref:Predicted protein n=1 Tax=Naegleria gruberi TaxID=5762 RepID=D2V2V9_NAEGR|nr:uncharacterized protein NAEGRDRAFT_63135 [Naegleria gruberi]EFC49129.1 predicted protein [Naegleria gruberi]|eukprot:XP_002681873.1 predicted protein [Naegleria gruberi strain NEG-M]